jgi:hypothetical protein
MKIISKITLYTGIILFLSIYLDDKADSKVEQPKTNIVISKSQIKVEAAPYHISGKIQIKKPVYKEKIALSPTLEKDN